MSKKFTPNVPDSSHPFNNVSLVKGDQGDPAQFCMPSSPILAIPTDASGDDGDFAAGIYWSSSQATSSSAWVQLFTDNVQGAFPKSQNLLVRPVRSFTASAGSYELRDAGPAGGVICYIDGTTFYEAAPSDISSPTEWSNIVDESVVGTSEEIGTGLANTNLIVDQDDHTASAAQACLDYSVGVYSDWYLGSKDLMEQLYLNVHVGGGSEVTANSASYLRIINGGEVIADEDTQNGWSITDMTIIGGTASGYGTLTFTLLTIYNETGYADITLSKTGEEDIAVRIHFLKMREGQQGIRGEQGIQGIQGDQGIQGEAGEDGTGIVVIKKTIGIEEAEIPVSLTEGAGEKISCETATAHSVVEGQKIEITSGSLGGAVACNVISVIDTTNFLVDLDYTTVDDPEATYCSLLNFRNIHSSSSQSVYFEDVVPARYKILSINFYCTVFDYPTSAAVMVNCGRAAYPSSGWYSYMSARQLTAVASQARVDLSEGVFTLNMNPDEVSFYITANTYPSTYTYWDEFTDFELEFMIVCEKLD